MEQQDFILNQIKQVILEILPGSKIFLFGSRAKNTHNEESDYDIMVVCKEEIPVRQKISIESRISKALSKLWIDADILLNSESEIRIKQTFPGHIVKDVLKEGILI